MQPTHIVIHHSATVDGRVNDWTAIKRYHTSWRFEGNIITEPQARELILQGMRGVEAPWLDIGYHFGLELDGDKYLWKVGRPLTMNGAACPEQGMNRVGIQICAVGNYDLNPVPELMFSLLIYNVRALKDQYQIPISNIKRHCDYASYKTCPGRKFQWQEFILNLQA